MAQHLNLSINDAGLPSEPGGGGELSAVLAPGDYMIMAACAGVDSAHLTFTSGDAPPETRDVRCGPRLEEFLRHKGGTISAGVIPAPGRPASAAGVTLKANDNPGAAELEDLSEWPRQQLKPAVPGEIAGHTSSSSGTGYGFQTEPGSYELQFLCEGTSAAEVSMVTWANSQVLAPQLVDCDGNTFSAKINTTTRGTDLRMDPASGEGVTRYAFRLIPAT